MSEGRRRDFGEPVVETPVKLRLPAGGTTNATVVVGKPYESDGGWRCPVEIRGFRRRYPDIAGEDALQALCLAIGLVRTEMLHLEEDGGEVLFQDSDEPGDLLATFGLTYSGVGGPIEE